MGLLFALQPDARASTAQKLVLRSHFRRFAMGGAFLFVALFMGVMTLAAAPLFKVMQQEGGFFDQLTVGFFKFVLVAYPLCALLCFSFEEHVVLTKRADGLFDLDHYKQLLFVRWGRKSFRGFALDALAEKNWVGAVNTAAVRSAGQPRKDRYATKGHWMLTLDGAVIERRARKEEIDWLKFLIAKHFEG